MDGNHLGLLCDGQTVVVEKLDVVYRCFVLSLGAGQECVAEVEFGEAH